MRWIAFEGARRLASGAPADVVRQVKRTLDRDADAPVLVFDAVSSERIELAWRNPLGELLRQLPPAPELAAEPSDAPAPPRGRGRPKLGVVAREVTLLPRHWEWLGTQPGGASVALRKLVEEARRSHAAQDAARQSRESAYRFMSTMAGERPQFEEASRALFAGDGPRFESLVADWPEPLREHLIELAAPSFTTTTPLQA